jgi:multisubunit Na+/H+ antiporter MnhE subunit
MYVFVTVPTWLLLGWFMLSGRFDRHPIIAGVIVAAFVIECIIHNTLFLKARFGGDR